MVYLITLHTSNKKHRDIEGQIVGYTLVTENDFTYGDLDFDDIADSRVESYVEDHDEYRKLLNTKDAWIHYNPLGWSIYDLQTFLCGKPWKDVEEYWIGDYMEHIARGDNPLLAIYE